MIKRDLKREKLKLAIKGFLVLGLLILTTTGASQLDKVREFFGKASGRPANFIVDTAKIVGQLPRPWLNLAQGGEDKNWSLKPINSKVKALKPEYIRIDHIYDFYDIVQGSPGNLTFNFSKLDRIINEILATGAKPYISLSYMPPAISRGDIIDQPVYWQDWQRVVQATVQHISGTRGISDVYYEVWNEPDLFGKWKYYGNKNYLTLYTYAVRGATNTKGTQPFKIGGPATTAFYKNWVDALLKHAAKNNLRLDFISWHRYTTDIQQYRRDAQDARQLLSQYPQFDGLTEVQITEWGHESDNHFGYDNRFAAAHTVAGAINMIGLVDRGFVFEIQDGNDPNGKTYWGRWGLLTSPKTQGVPKPRYQALKLLNKLAGQRLQLLGQGSWVKGVAVKTPDKKVQMVIANFDPKGRHAESVPITFTNIDPGKYLIKTQRLSGRNSRLYISTTSAELKVNIPMFANDVAFLEMGKE